MTSGSPSAEVCPLFRLVPLAGGGIGGRSFGEPQPLFECFRGKGPVCLDDLTSADAISVHTHRCFPPSLRQCAYTVASIKCSQYDINNLIVIIFSLFVFTLPLLQTGKFSWLKFC